MMITRESDYGVRIIRALKDGGLMTIGQICERECIPKQFAYKILKKLELAGLVQIKRGFGGAVGAPIGSRLLAADSRGKENYARIGRFT